jgi:hypothetical protein
MFANASGALLLEAPGPPQTGGWPRRQGSGHTVLFPGHQKFPCLPDHTGHPINHCLIVNLHLCLEEASQAFLLEVYTKLHEAPCFLTCFRQCLTLLGALLRLHPVEDGGNWGKPQYFLRRGDVTFQLAVHSPCKEKA